MRALDEHPLEILLEADCDAGLVAYHDEGAPHARGKLFGSLQGNVDAFLARQLRRSEHRPDGEISTATRREKIVV